MTYCSTACAKLVNCSVRDKCNCRSFCRVPNHEDGRRSPRAAHGQGAGSSSKGKLVLATVKAMCTTSVEPVDIICTNNGYEVHNIGIKIPISEMIAKVQEVDADALGMSACS